MALDISQIVAASYPAVVADQRKPANQWADNAALKALERFGFVNRIDMGESIEAPLDYRANPDTAVLASDQDAAPLLKTEVFTAATYAVAQMNVPVTWTKGDDAKTPTVHSKIEFAASLLTNGIDSHDDLIEQSVFTSSTAGGDELLGLNTLVPTSGTGTVGGIDASVETWWKNPVFTYVDETDIEAAMTDTYNDCAKGSGAMLIPKLILGGSAPHALYESTLVAQQRWMDGKEADGGFKALFFKGAPFVFSQYGGDNMYFLNPKNYNLKVSKSYFRDKGQTETVPGQNAFYFLIYSALQFITNNKSRLGVCKK